MPAPEGESIVSRVVNGHTSKASRTSAKGAVCYEFTDKDGENKRVRLARDIDPSYSDAITTSDPDARDYSDPLPEYPLPGAGELGDDCGEEFPGLYCTDCFAPHTVGRTCRNPDCPRCWNSWAFHRAKDMASKLEALGREKYTNGNTNIKQHHVTVSIRDSTRFNSKDPFKRGIESVKALLGHVDVSTGYAVYHPYRIAPEYRGSVLGHESGDGDMTWKDVLEKVEGDSWTWAAVREEFLIYAPHFHVICLANFVDTTSVGEIEEQTGAVIHRITTTREDGKEKSIDGVEELSKVTAYCLSHAGIAPENERKTHRAAVRAFGTVANYEAFESAKADVTEALRAVSQKVLGIEFSERECHEHVPKDRDCDHDHGHSHDSGSGSASGPGPAVSVLTGDDSDSPSGSGSSDGFASALASDGGHAGGQSDSWSETSGSVPSGLNVATDTQTEPCDGKLAPIWRAEADLGNLIEINRVESRYGSERIHELRQAVEEWRDMGSPRPPEVGDTGDR